MKYKIEFNKEKCLGCGACTECNNWEMGNDGKAHPIKIELDNISCNKDVVDLCPATAIKITRIGE